MDVVIDLLFNNPYVPWVVGAVVLYFAYRALADRVRVRVPGVGLSREDLLSKALGPRFTEAKLQKAVDRLKKQESHLAAGKLLEDADRLAEAAETYLEGREYWAAAATYEKMGRQDKAAELFLQAGDYKKAAALFAASGKPARAAALYQEKGNNLEAARLYGLAGQWQTAAELYTKSGYPLRAAEAWEKQGEYLRAAEAYERHFMENVSFSTTYSSTAPAGEVKSAARAGKLYEKAGQLDRAVQAYQKGGFHAEAAEALLKLGQPDKAAELFLRAEDPARAAAAYEQAGDEVRAAYLRGEAAFKADRPAEAAAFFVKGRDFLRAAELFEGAGMLGEAAAAFEAGESWAAAGSVYLRARLKDRAAAAYEKGGEWETAARLYEELGQEAKAAELFGRAGLTFKSGEAAARAGQREKAIALLQQVAPGDENYHPATELLARLFIESRMPALALERVQKAIGEEPVSRSTLDLYYWLALSHEAAGAQAPALAIYKKIQAEDLQFRDVGARVARLQTAAAAVPPGSPASPPAPASSSAASATAPAPAAPAPRPPRFVPREEIGRGPLGVVHRGEDTTDGRNVAVRILPASALAPEGLLPALVAELRAASQISHPNLVKVIALMELQGERCLVTEYVPGKNFAEAVRGGRRMSFQQVHALGRIVTQALTVVHGKGLVHGSIQPSNVLVASGVIKLADLGLGRLAHGLGRAEAENYRAPENRLDVAGDLYALVAVMYHLLTGSHPRLQPQGAALPLPSRLAPGVPESMDKLLLRGLHPRPELRYATAEDLLTELREMVKIG
jgi:serine/threonine-protein kinase